MKFSCRISVLEMERFDIDGGVLLLSSYNPSSGLSPSDNLGSTVGISLEGFQ
jgi:hypothetical protein